MHITLQMDDNETPFNEVEKAVLQALAGQAAPAKAPVGSQDAAKEPVAAATPPAAEKPAPAKKTAAKKAAAPAPDPEPEPGSDEAAFEDLQSQAVEKASEVLHTGPDGRAFVLERLAEADAKKVSEIVGMDRLQAFYDAVNGYPA
jgi:hypothetical protein